MDINIKIPDTMNLSAELIQEIKDDIIQLIKGKYSNFSGQLYKQELENYISNYTQEIENEIAKIIIT